MIFVKDQETKISQASDQTASTPPMTLPTRTKAKDSSSEIVTDIVPIRVVPGRAPTKKRTNTTATKNAKSSHVSEPSHHSMSIELPTKKPKKVASLVSVKKAHYMTSLYVNPLSMPDVKSNVGTSDKNTLDLVLVLLFKHL